MEAYARAMVHEFDRTNCTSCGHLHDQCFHNYLVHFDRLLGANRGRISAVETHQQGKGGIVNTVGLVSKRNNGASLKELGLVQNGTKLILDNDKTTVSAVIHMFDRDPEMNDWVQGAMDEEMFLWNATRSLSHLLQRDSPMLQGIGRPHGVQALSNSTTFIDTTALKRIITSS